MKHNIRQRGKSFTALWYVVDPGTGKRKQHSKGGFRTKGEAQSHLNTVVAKVEANEWTKDRKMTVEQLLTEWLAAKKSEGLRPATVAQYTNIIHAWLVPHIGAMKLASLSPKQAQELVETLRSSGGRNSAPLSDRSVQIAVVVLKAATTWAVDTRIISRDPLLGFKRPRARASKDATAAWSSDEARTFLTSVASDRLLAAWSLFLTRGLRRGELAGLRWDAIDLEGGSLHIIRTRVLVDGQPVDSIPKTAAGKRWIPLDEHLVTRLRSHQTRQRAEYLAVGKVWSDGEHVFTNELGEPLHPEYFSTRFETLTDRAGLRRIRLHDLRHTAASRMMEEGVQAPVVAEMLGHSSPTITQTIYQHVTRGMSEKAGADLSKRLLGG